MIEATRQTEDIVPQILDHGYGRLRLATCEALDLHTLYGEATRFFARHDKDDFSVPGFTDAYRPFATGNTPYGPDLNDSFLYWSHRDQLGPYKRAQIAAFRRTLQVYTRDMREIVSCIVLDLLKHYGSQQPLRFGSASVLQVNSFLCPADREFYQFAHEDADLLTVIWASHPGLEMVLDATVEPVDFAPDEVLIMPGSILTAMTGEQIRPFYHQVRNLGDPDRKSVMYFVSPEPGAQLQPLVRNATTQRVDLSRLVVENPQTYFGLDPGFVAAQDL